MGPKPKRDARDIEESEGFGTDGDELEMQDKPPITFPLKDVMRREAAKHNESAKEEPLCDLIRIQWPEAACDENISQHNARMFYHDNCGKKTKNIIPGVDCQGLRHSIKKIYPDVDKDPKVHVIAWSQHQHPATCQSEAMNSLVPLYGETGAANVLKNMFADREWAEDYGICTGNDNNTAQTTRRHTPRVCILPYCEPTEPGVNCHDLEKELEKHFDIDYTSSDDECGHSWKRNHTQAERRADYPNTYKVKFFHQICIQKAYRKLGDILGDTDEVYDSVNTLFNDTRWTSDDDVCNDPNPPRFDLPEGKGEKRCVKKYCPPSLVDAVGSGVCNDVAAVLNELSKDAGHKVEWTTDANQCGHELGWERSHNLSGA